MDLSEYNKNATYFFRQSLTQNGTMLQHVGDNDEQIFYYCTEISYNDTSSSFMHIKKVVFSTIYNISKMGCHSTSTI